MWIMLLATLAVDTTVHSVITVAPRETLSVTVTGSGAPIVLIPGLFGSAYGFRHLVGPLAEDGYRAITIEPLGVGTSARPKERHRSAPSEEQLALLVGKTLDVAIDAVADVGHFMFEERPEVVLSALVQIRQHD